TLTAQRSTGFPWLEAYHSNLTHVAVATKALLANSGRPPSTTSLFSEARASNATIALSQGDVLYLISAVAETHASPQEALNGALALLDNVGAADVAALAMELEAWWADFWAKSSVSLPEAPLVERFWYGAAYILALSSRPGSTAPGMYGPFATMDEMRWQGGMTLNYNAEATFYGAVASGHPELLLSFFAPIMAYARSWGGMWAKQLFRCPGVYFSGHISQNNDVFGMIDNGQRTNNLFVALHFASHWLYMRDEALAASTLQPFLKSVAEFWQCYLTKSTTAPGQEYRYDSVNDCFMEQCGLPVEPRGAYGFYDPTIINTNPPQEIALLRYALESLVDMSTTLGCDAELVPAWQDILDHLPAYPTAPVNCSLRPPQGDAEKRMLVGAEGAAPQQPGSNPVETSAIWPGSRDFGLSSPPELLAIARNTIEVVHHTPPRPPTLVTSSRFRRAVQSEASGRADTALPLLVLQ
ncbi:hypothetical protein CYMTET_30102, partial [Cymbomonas tetramitiformis]